jgi:hypothetical protein
MKLEQVSKNYGKTVLTKLSFIHDFNNMDGSTWSEEPTATQQSLIHVLILAIYGSPA